MSYLDQVKFDVKEMEKSLNIKVSVAERAAIYNYAHFLDEKYFKELKVLDEADTIMLDLEGIINVSNGLDKKMVGKLISEDWEMCDDCNSVSKCLKANKCLDK